MNLTNKSNQNKMNRPFHLAIGVSDLNQAREFYTGVMQVQEGRSSDLWIDFHFFGHQLTCHLTDKKTAVAYNQVDKTSVPIPHFGLIVSNKEFEELREKLKKNKIEFIVKPQIRFKNLPEEQRTMFFKDPFENCIEIKSFTNVSEY